MSDVQKAIRIQTLSFIFPIDYLYSNEWEIRLQSVAIEGQVSKFEKLMWR